MEIVVCIKRVPDLSEAELAIDESGRRVDDADLTFDLNEWDNFAVEEAVRLKELHGGRVTALTIGDEESEEVLRRALAMGADEALHLCDEAFEDADPRALASLLASVLKDRPFDLVLCGAISADGTSGHTGGMLAALLDVPQVALATAIEVKGAEAEVRHEVEGGLERVVAVSLPAVVSVQTGINEPRYVSIRGIRKVADVEIPLQSAADLGLSAEEFGAAGSRVTVEELFPPPQGGGGEILDGDDVDEAVATLVARLHERGGL
jgi:electron transfer flavoprotein beta subunit